MQITKDILSYSIVLTNACCLKCSHCFLGDRKTSNNTIKIDKVKKLVARIMETTKYPSFDWGGGEPLLLGKEYMSKVVSLDCFNGNIKNTLYSTFLINYDNDWKEILNRFSSLIFSLDSYRLKDSNFNLKKALSVVGDLKIKKEISYTPALDDKKEDIEKYFKIASDIGAEVFHVGFLYDDENLLSPRTYIETLRHVEDLQSKYGMPEIGYRDKGENIYHRVGWRAYDCFTKCIYICEGIITSCYILYSRGYPVPFVNMDDFIDGEADIVNMNNNFIHSFFLEDRIEKCFDCEHYSLCMGGCPYFTWKSKSNIDIYCGVYKEIFKNMEQTGA